jgi:hypothetical protein
VWHRPALKSRLTAPSSVKTMTFVWTRRRRRAWEAASHKHVREYDDLLAQAVAGSSLNDVERELLAGILSLSPEVVHLQSGHGLDDAALVQAGAMSVVGVDYSAVAAGAAQCRADELGLACRYVVGAVPGVPLAAWICCRWPSTRSRSGGPAASAQRPGTDGCPTDGCTRRRCPRALVRHRQEAEPVVSPPDVAGNLQPRARVAVGEVVEALVQVLVHGLPPPAVFADDGRQAAEPGSPAHPRSHMPDYAQPSNIKSGLSGPVKATGLDQF